MTLNDLEPSEKGFLVNFSQYLDAAHLSILNCDEMAGVRPRQLAYEIFSIKRRFQQSKSRSSMFMEPCAGRRQRLQRFWAAQVYIIHKVAPRYWRWWCGIVGNAFRLKRSYSTPGPVSTAMGDYWTRTATGFRVSRELCSNYLSVPSCVTAKSKMHKLKNNEMILLTTSKQSSVIRSQNRDLLETLLQ